MGTIIGPVRHAYPLLLDVTDRLIVLVGGGAVAARKAAGLLEAGATHVRCISRTFHPDLPGAVVRVDGPYEARHLEGAWLVFAATDSPDVNDAVVRDAQERGILVNRADADEQDPGNFVVPARLRKGPITVTVSAGSPALAAAVRDGLLARWDERWTAMAEAMQALRPVILSAALPQGERAMVFRHLATDEALGVLAGGGIEALKTWLRARHPELAVVF